jgi:hypothetical protein
MKVRFKTHRGQKVSFTARPSKHRCPKHLKKFLFKPRTKKLSSALSKARAKLKRMGWRF